MGESEGTLEQQLKRIAEAIDRVDRATCRDVNSLRTQIQVMGRAIHEISNRLEALEAHANAPTSPELEARIAGLETRADANATIRENLGNDLEFLRSNYQLHLRGHVDHKLFEPDPRFHECDSSSFPDGYHMWSAVMDGKNGLPVGRRCGFCDKEQLGKMIWYPASRDEVES